MAQLFSVYFPQYCFELQEEFSITFPNANNLPFDPDVSHKGVPHIRSIQYDHDTHDTHRIKRWAACGLKEGLRIVSINDNILVTEQQGGINTTSDNDIITRNEILSKIDEIGTAPITFTLSEDIPSFDDSEPLGLTFIAPPDKKESAQDIEPNKLTVDIPFDPVYEIRDNAISVSSFKDEHVPEHVRLNYPGHWSPSDNNARSRDVWICIDLGAKKLVDMIEIQGNIDHTAYVQSLWIEYSDDMCAWKSHPMRCVKCHYIRSEPAEKVKPGENEEEKQAPLQIEKSSIILPNYTTEKLQYDTASIKLWPVINAQFIRIRPTKWRRSIAMRLELLGNHRPLDHQQIGKVVTANTVCAQFKPQLQPLLVNKPQDTCVIQIDCKAIVTKAMDLAGCTSHSIINTDDTNCLLVVTTPNAATSDRVMDSLTNIGVGRQFGVISSIPVEWRNAATNIEQEGLPEDATSTGFAASVKSHAKVQVVVERIMNSASLTFDYSCMLIVASMIAVGGLATDSAVIVVASMLVSPIMGPVLAFTFGVTLSNWPMARLGLCNECISLLSCVLIGFVVGFFYALGTKNRNDWPTNEMESRGDPWALSDGAFIAFVSGIGVALSVLGDYLSTVVGVAISASLLPPAVNCGMLLSFCLYESIKPQCVAYPGCGDTPSVHDYSARDTAISATLSLVLTIENIFFIFVAAWIMFKIKDIVETKDRNQRLWDYISQFKAQHKMLHKSAKKDETTSVMKQLSEQASVSFAAHGNYEYDVFTAAGSQEQKAIGEVQKTVAYAENDIIHSTLKGEVFKRQVSTYYHHRARGESGDGIVSDASAEYLLSPKETNSKGKEKPHLSVIFSENKPLMQDDEGDDVENVVVDANDP